VRRKGKEARNENSWVRKDTKFEVLFSQYSGKEGEHRQKSWVSAKRVNKKLSRAKPSFEYSTQKLSERSTTLCLLGKERIPGRSVGGRSRLNREKLGSFQGGFL